MTQVNPFEFEEDDSCWIPLKSTRKPQEPVFNNEKQNEHFSTSPHTLSSSSGQSGASSMIFKQSTSSSRSYRGSSYSGTTPSLETIRKRLETKQQLTNRFVDHPVQLFRKQFLIHFARELWKLDPLIRLGIISIVIGAAFKFFFIMMWYAWYPRTSFILLIGTLSYFYLDPLNINTIINSSSIEDALLQLDISQLRLLCFLLLLIPTLLETMTLSLLSQIIVDVDYTLIYRWSVTLGVALSVYLAMLYYKTKGFSPRDCTQSGLLVLYGSTLILALVRTEWRQLPLLAGPFFFATGALLLARTEDEEWVARVLRHSLRLTLRDVFTEVGTSVQEDEMLQLAMLRWIVDYWSNTPPPTKETPAEQTNQTSNTNSTQKPASHSVQNELQWDELQSMLSITTDQMATEVESLQKEQLLHAGVQGSTSNNDNSSNANPSTIPAFNNNANRKGDSATNAATENDSVKNMKSMLAHMDVDDRARPAVMAYKKTVEAFPPTRKIAILLSMARRCPAALALAWHIAFGFIVPVVGVPSPFTTATLILFPFLIFEKYRVERWIQSCCGVSLNETKQDYQSMLDDVEPMTLLLSGEDSRRPTSLLLIWRNIENSVSSLETSLTATRCVQTTAVAVEFAENVMSLAHLGFEVSQYGWVYGLSVIMKELVFHFGTQTSAQEARYTNAAFDAVRNGQRVARNIHVLREEENIRMVVHPLVDSLAMIIGRGWLWDREEGEPEQPSISKSEIEKQKQRESKDPVNTVETVKNDVGENKGESDRGGNKSESDSEKKDTRTEGNVTKSMCTSHESVEKNIPAEVNLDAKGGLTKPTHNSEKVETLDVTPKVIPVEGKDKMATAFDLIAIAYEKGLIEESEKNDFCEKLAAASTQYRSSDSNGSTNNEKFVLGMINTLQGLLDDGENQHTEPTLIGKAGHGVGVASSSFETSNVSTFAGAESCERKQNISLSVAAAPKTVGMSSLSMERTCDNDTLLKNQSLVQSNDCEIILDRKGDIGDGSTSSQRQNQSIDKEENDNFWAAWGAGLAVAGVTVVGAVFAIAGHNNNQEGEEKKNPEYISSNAASSVQIEQLDDDHSEEDNGDAHQNGVNTL